jgi:hypothetical protein
MIVQRLTYTLEMLIMLEENKSHYNVSAQCFEVSYVKI